MKPDSNYSPIADRILWSSIQGVPNSGMSARITLYTDDCKTFELYTQYAGSVPIRHVSQSLGELNMIADAFLAARKADGYQEQLPSFNPDCWIV